MPGDLYEKLGVSRSADTNEIRKAFRKLAVQHHPDKGGDEEKFKEIQHAHDILTDDRRRQIYDMTGSEDEHGGMPGGMGGMGVPFDIGSIFSGMADFGGMGIGGMFGGMGGGRRAPGNARTKIPKGPPKIQEIPLTLHDYYHGRQFQVKFERQKFCEICKGEGATSFQSCGPCQGRGILRQMMMMGPINMINEGPCGECQGSGKKASGNCYMCGGKKTKPQEKSLDVKIEAGMKPGEILIFEKECSDEPHYEEAGDVHFVLQEAEGDEGWSRKENDLFTSVKIGLGQSLLGCIQTLKGHPGFPDGLPISIPAGTVNKQVLLIHEQGMTKKGGGHGNLHVEVLVTVSDKEREILERNKPLLVPMFS